MQLQNEHSVESSELASRTFNHSYTHNKLPSTGAWQSNSDKRIEAIYCVYVYLCMLYVLVLCFVYSGMEERLCQMPEFKQ